MKESIYIYIKDMNLMKNLPLVDFRFRPTKKLITYFLFLKLMVIT